MEYLGGYLELGCMALLIFLAGAAVATALCLLIYFL